MAYAYVKSGGTATGTAGKYTTAKTGSWSTAFTNVNQYYNNLQSCLSGASLSSGDVIYISNIHSHQYTISAHTSVTTSIKNIYCYSVNDTDLSIFTVGATEYFYYSGTSSLTVTYGVGYLYGITIRVTHNLNLSLSGLNANSDYPTILSYENCTFLLETSSYSRYLSTAASAIFSKCTFNFNSASNSPRYISSSSSILFKNCTFIGPSNSNALLISSQGQIYCEGCNFHQISRPIFTAVSYPSSVIIVSKGSESGTYNNPTVTSTSRDKAGKFFTDNIYSYRRYGFNTKIEIDPSVYRQGGASWDQETYYSYKVSTSAIGRFKLCEFYKAPVKNQKLEVYFAHNNLSSLLTNDGVKLEFSYVDGTTYKSVYLYTEDLMQNAFSSYTNLPGSSEIWVGLSGVVYKQQISLVIPSSGVYGLCSVWLKLPSLGTSSVYICPKAELV